MVFEPGQKIVSSQEPESEVEVGSREEVDGIAADLIY